MLFGEGRDATENGLIWELVIHGVDGGAHVARILRTRINVIVVFWNGRSEDIGEGGKKLEWMRGDREKVMMEKTVGGRIIKEMTGDE